MKESLSYPRHAEYLGHWITLLTADAKAIFTATGKATEAARYLETAGGLSPDEARTEENGAGEREG